MSLPKPESASDRRREEIAAAAIALIAEHGFEGLRTRDVAAKVGINIATLHYHVPSKEALAELVAQAIRSFFMMQNIRRPRANLPALERLRAEFADLRETFFERPEFIVVMAELMQRALRDPKIDAIIRPMLEFWNDHYAALFTDGKAEGTFRADLDPVAAAHIVTGAFMSFRRQADTTSDQFDAFTAEIERLLRAPSEKANDPDDVRFHPEPR